MSVVHIVMFAYAPSLSADDKSNLAQRFLALKEACRSQDSGQPYVVSVEAGANNSPEGLAKGLEHAFVMRFDSHTDLNYYLDHDPAHQDFKKFVKDKVVDVCVLDFDNGKF